jgi:hypothetical protein
MIPISRPILQEAAGTLASSIDFALHGPLTKDLTIIVTIPRSLVIDGAPSAFIDGEPARNVSSGQDSGSYYITIWGDLGSNTVSIRFTNPDDPGLFAPAYMSITVVATVIIAGGAVSLRIARSHSRNGRHHARKAGTA